MTSWITIPGETPIDPTGLKIPGITTRRQLNVVEAQNILLATTKYLSKKPNTRTARYDQKWCLQLHKEMFGQVWKWAGQTRQHNLNFGVPFYQISSCLYDLLQDLQTWQTHSMPLLEQAARLHHRAVFIHPFENGNGRWSRMLANIWLRRNGHHYTKWPERTIGETSVIRNAYLDAIKKADNGDYQPLVDLHQKYSTSATP